MRGERLTRAENKLFEEALVIFGEEDPNLLLRLIVLDNPTTKLSEKEKEDKNGSLKVKSKIVNSGKGKAPEVHCYSHALH